jgi:3-oxoadipate enol-lactonase
MPFARVGRVHLHYRINSDSAGPPLVLSNSLGAALEMWEPQMAALASRFRVVRYDSRGHGQSDVPRGPYSIDDLGNDVLGLLDTIGIDRAHFCGLSMGGAIGLWLGVNAPERIDRLVVANTGAKIGNAESWNARIDAVRRDGMASIASAVLSRWFSRALLEQPTPLVAKLRRTFEATSSDGYASACAAVRDFDLRRVVHRIHVPTLVIAGSQDVSTPAADARFLAEEIRGARYVELEAPHLSNIQAASAFTQALLHFLIERH